MFGFSWWTLAKYGIPLFVVALSFFAVWHFSKSFIASYNATFAQVAKLEAEVVKYKNREVSYKRQLERYKASVAALPKSCRDSMNKWVRNPDTIPRPFNPHEQFTPPNLKDNRLDGTDTRPVTPDDWTYDGPWKWENLPSMPSWLKFW